MEKALPILQKYTTLEIGQLARLISTGDNYKKAREVIHDMINRRILCRQENRVQAGHSYQKALYCGDEIIKSVWVMLDLTKGIARKEIIHGLDVYPFDTHFIVSDRMEYRLLIVTQTTPHLILRMTDRRPDTGSVCYVLITENPVFFKNIEIPTDVPCIFAHYTRPDAWGEPIIKYYKDKEKRELWVF